MATNSESLKEYAAAAVKIGSRPWVQRGIDWCANCAKWFYREGGHAKFARRTALRRAYATGATSEPAWLDSYVEQVAKLGGPSLQEDIRLLDIGSCQSLFTGCQGIAATPIDLCPHPASPAVLQCDFLGLEIGAPYSSPVVTPSEEFVARWHSQVADCQGPPS